MKSILCKKYLFVRIQREYFLSVWISIVHIERFWKFQKFDHLLTVHLPACMCTQYGPTDVSLVIINIVWFVYTYLCPCIYLFIVFLLLLSSFFSSAYALKWHKNLHCVTWISKADHMTLIWAMANQTRICSMFKRHYIFDILIQISSQFLW